MTIAEYRPSTDHDFTLYHDDVIGTLAKIRQQKFDMIFADPPYFLSNGGISVQAGRMVSVNKGEWDKSQGRSADRLFTFNWLKACREVMTESASIWICGTFHNIFTVADVLSELNFKMLNAVTWQKTNPPPNLSCRYFTHSTELLVWARKEKRIPHYYNYDLMHKIADDRQMTDVWRMPAIAPWEKTCGKHPTQKPLALVVRAILASTKEHDRILDPFTGSGTTGIAAQLTNRSFTGIDIEAKYLSVAAQRHELLPKLRHVWISKIPDLKMLGLA
jgi:site-specific DNA-methyltransferase (adenine-specific)